MTRSLPGSQACWLCSLPGLGHHQPSSPPLHRHATPCQQAGWTLALLVGARVMHAARTFHAVILQGPWTEPAATEMPEGCEWGS